MARAARLREADACARLQLDLHDVGPDPVRPPARKTLDEGPILEQRGGHVKRGSTKIHRVRRPAGFVIGAQGRFYGSRISSVAAPVQRLPRFLEDEHLEAGIELSADR